MSGSCSPKSTSTDTIRFDVATDNGTYIFRSMKVTQGGNSTYGPLVVVGPAEQGPDIRYSLSNGTYHLIHLAGEKDRLVQAGEVYFVDNPDGKVELLRKTWDSQIADNESLAKQFLEALLKEKASSP